MERDGDGENLNFAGMVEAVGGGGGCGVCGCGCWWWCRCSGVATLQAARLQGCKYSDIQSVSLHLFCCGLLLGCVGVFVPLAGCTVPGMVEAGGGGVGVVVVLVGVVVAVVGRDWQAIPPSSSV